MKCLNTLAKGGLMVAFMLLFSNFVLAQRTVKGKVTDAETGEGLIGATVTVVGTTRGAVTDIDGNYSVEVPDGSTQLRFAYTGYAEEVVTLSSSNVVEVAMKPGTVLDEVVVVGYGTLKTREITGSVASVKAENFVKGNVNDPAQLLQGKVAGLSITRPGNDPNGGFNIRLRGLSTLGQNTTPLIVVDGVPGFNLNAIDPNTIESIDVLKDGSAAAIYGTRASSGVILITTRKGQAGVAKVEYNGQFSFENIERRVNVLNAADFKKFVPNATDLGANTDWLDEVTRGGFTQLHSLGLSGGTGKTTYNATLSYRDVNGIAKKTGFDQYLANLSIQQKALNNRLLLSANLGITNRNSELGFSEAFRYATIFNPTAPVTKDGKYFEVGGFEQFNPVAIIEQNSNDRDANNYFGNVRADLTLLDGLTLGAFVSRTRQTDQTDEYYSRETLYRSGNRGLARSETFNSYNDLIETTLNYDKSFGKLNFKGLLGYSWQELAAKGWTNQAANVEVNNFGVNNWAAYADLKAGQFIATSYRNQNNIIAQFGRINLGWDDTYYATASLRREGSSRFGENNKWGLFPAVSAGVALDKLFSISGVNSLRLRAGYGVTGATPRDSYLSLAKVAPSGQTFPLGGTNVPTWGPSGGRNPNADLKWERKSDINVGVDFAIMDYKLTGSLEYYRSNVTDLIYELPVALPANLFDLTWANAGKIQNGGVELAVTYNHNDFWSTSLVGTAYQRTRLLEFYRNFKTLEVGVVGAPGQNSSYYQVLSVQDSANLNIIGTFVALDIAKVGTDGKYVYFDKDGNETTDKSKARKTVAGNALPKYELGWTNNFKFGRFDAQLFLRGVFGHSLANEFRVFYENLGDNNGFNKVDTKYFNEKLTEGNSYNSTHIEKANFLRIENLTIGYNLPLSAGAWFSKARVFFTGQQLFTFTKYSGVDPSPRFQDSGNVDNGNRPPVFQDPLIPGIDRRNTYFTTRTFNLGVNLGF